MNWDTLYGDPPMSDVEGAVADTLLNIVLEADEGSARLTIAADGVPWGTVTVFTDDETSYAYAVIVRPDESQAIARRHLVSPETNGG